MLPTNSNEAKQKGCTPVSSNCVIWNGPDLDCIGICKGDSISEVMHTMATELCRIMDELDITNYDLSCFIDCPTPQTYQELIQLLIEKVCALENIDPGTGAGSTAGCPDDCIVTIASCFEFTNPQGDTVTTMTLIEYVTAIGNKICDILTDLTTLEAALESLGVDVDLISTRVTALESGKADANSLQYQNAIPLDPSGTPKFITEALRTVEDNFVNQLGVLGAVGDLYQAILRSQDFNAEERVGQAGPYSTDPGWTSAITNLSEAINNAWIIFEDQLAALRDIQNNCCDNGCGGIKWNFRAVLDDSGAPTIYVRLYFDGSTGLDGFRDTDPVGTIFTITDSAGNSTTSRLNVIATVGDPSGFAYQVDTTPIDHTLDLTVTVQTDVYNPNSGVTCVSPQIDVISGNVSCPALIISPFTIAITYNFPVIPGFSYTVELFEASGTIAVDTDIYTNPVGSINGTFTGLIQGTNYEIGVTIENTAGEKTVCPRSGVTTLLEPCTPPNSVVTQITIP